jgi:hypothetical protein
LILKNESLDLELKDSKSKKERLSKELEDLQSMFRNSKQLNNQLVKNFSPQIIKYLQSEQSLLEFSKALFHSSYIIKTYGISIQL